MEYQVEEAMRFDQALSLGFGISRSKAQKYIKEQQAFVNGLTKACSYQVQEGDWLTLTKQEEEITDIVKEDIPISVVYEDDGFLVINKQSGMVVHPAPGHYTKTLVNALCYRFSLSHEDSLRPGIIHRLDKDTSGLMLVAKNDEMHDKLSEMIAKKEVERIYLAIVSGVIPNETGTIDAPIGRDPKDREKMKVTDQNAKHAVTHFKVLKRYKNHTLVACKLETGRTHQIRVHMAYIGYPVANDPVYGISKHPTAFGQMLHSYRLSFIHPITKESLSFQVDPPQEFKKMQEELETLSDL